MDINLQRCPFFFINGRANEEKEEGRWGGLDSVVGPTDGI